MPSMPAPPSMNSRASTTPMAPIMRMRIENQRMSAYIVITVFLLSYERHRPAVPCVNMQQIAATQQTKGGICGNYLHFMRCYPARQRLSSKALVITLTELSAMAAPATTGFR